jgi:thymidine kinase
MNIPQLIACIGPMWGGKTSTLLSYLERFKYQNKKIAAFKPKADNRYSDTKIMTHSGWNIDAIPVEFGGEIVEWVEKNLPDADVIGIDEFFLIQGANFAANILYKNGKTVIFSSLSLSSDVVPFFEVKEILPYCTKIISCPAICSMCDKDAHFTYAKVHKDKTIEIGGADKYEPLCHKHYFELRAK